MNIAPFQQQLGANAEVFSALIRGVSAVQATWKPEPQKWSILEVVNHLADEEHDDFRTRLELTLKSPDREWPSIDPEGWVLSRNYAAQDLEESLERFLTERRASLEWLATLPAPDWNSTHTHPRHGAIRAGDLLASWVEHDFLHIRQLLTLQREYYRHLAPEYAVRYAGDW